MSINYRCLNIGNCSKADTRESISLTSEVDPRCPECDSELLRTSSSSSGNTSYIPWIVGLVITAAIGSGIYWYASSPTIISDADMSSVNDVNEVLDTSSSDQSAPQQTSLPVNTTPSSQGQQPYQKANTSFPERDSSTSISPSAESVSWLERGIAMLDVYKTSGKKNKVETLNNVIALLSKSIDGEKANNNCYTKALVSRSSAYLELDKPNKAEEDARAAVSCEPKSPIAHYSLATVFSIQKKNDLALEQLSASLDNGFSDCRYLRSDQDLASIRALPEYRSILEEHKLFCLK